MSSKLRAVCEHDGGTIYTKDGRWYVLLKRNGELFSLSQAEAKRALAGFVAGNELEGDHDH